MLVEQQITITIRRAALSSQYFQSKHPCCVQAVIGRGQVVGGSKRISLCRNIGGQSESEDEREIPSSRDVSTFGSAESDDKDFGERPSASCLSDAAAAAAGNSFSGKFDFDSHEKSMSAQTKAIWLSTFA